MRPHFAAVVATTMSLLAVAGTGTAGGQAVAATSSAQSKETKWVVDMVHSQVDFGVRHLVGRVRGTFTKWYAILSTKSGDWKQGKVDVQIETASLNTGNAYRDADLRSDRFFDVAKYPKMTFQGTGITATDSIVDVSGILTIKGHSKPVILSGQYLGIAKDREGHQRIAFEAGTVLDRREFGINWNENVAGAELIGNDVTITIGIEAVRAN
jgi:polyisoprenoid-binding protein YceI